MKKHFIKSGKKTFQSTRCKKIPENIHKDFHGALSTGFKYLSEKYGKGVLEEFLKICGKNMYGWLIKKIKREGLLAIERYWNEIFSLEGADFEIDKRKDGIILRVLECPAIIHMKKAGYDIYNDFCVQCRVINEIIAEETGFKSAVSYDQQKGRCVQKFKRGL